MAGGVCPGRGGPAGTGAPPPLPPARAEGEEATLPGEAAGQTVFGPDGNSFSPRAHGAGRCRRPRARGPRSLRLRLVLPDSRRRAPCHPQRRRSGKPVHPVLRSCGPARGAGKPIRSPSPGGQASARQPGERSGCAQVRPCPCRSPSKHLAPQRGRSRREWASARGRPVPIKLYSHKQAVGRPCPAGSSVSTPGAADPSALGLPSCGSGKGVGGAGWGHGNPVSRRDGSGEGRPTLGRAQGAGPLGSLSLGTESPSQGLLLWGVTPGDWPWLVEEQRPGQPQQDPAPEPWPRGQTLGRQRPANPRFSPSANSAARPRPQEAPQSCLAHRPYPRQAGHQSSRHVRPVARGGPGWAPCPLATLGAL